MYGLGMRPGRASLPRLQHPASSTQSEHLREAGPGVLQKLGPTPSRFAAAATRPGPFPEYAKT